MSVYPDRTYLVRDVLYTQVSVCVCSEYINQEEKKNKCASSHALDEFHSSPSPYMDCPPRYDSHAPHTDVYYAVLQL